MSCLVSGTIFMGQSSHLSESVSASVKWAKCQLCLLWMTWHKPKEYMKTLCVLLNPIKHKIYVLDLFRVSIWFTMTHLSLRVVFLSTRMTPLLPADITQRSLLHTTTFSRLGEIPTSSNSQEQMQKIKQNGKMEECTSNEGIRKKITQRKTLVKQR